MIEAVGTPEAYETAVEMVRRGGGVVVVGMYAGESVEVQLGVYWARALDRPVRGHHARCTRGGSGRWQDVRAGALDPAPLISHRLPLDDAAEGYALFDRREATKVLLAAVSVTFRRDDPAGLVAIVGGLLTAEPRARPGAPQAPAAASRRRSTRSTRASR